MVNRPAIFKMKLDSSQLLVSFTFICITALQNGIDFGIIYCKGSQQNIGATIKVEKGDFGYIASSGYPNNYTTEVYHGHLCNVELQACSTCKIRLKFEELRFPACDSQPTLVVQQIRSVCITGCDHIRIFEVNQPYHKTTERNYFAKAEGQLYETISSSVVIQHCMSNGSYSDGKKMYIKYEVIDKSHVITGTSSAPSYSVGTGIITSPNFPYGYALNGETFTYMLQNLDPYGHVRLVFDDWDVAEKSQIQVYDELPGPNRAVVKHSTLLSSANTLVLVFNTGTDMFACCNHMGFKATYTFVSGDKWTERPRTDCSKAYILQTGGMIEFNTDPTDLPQWYDCVWTIKRYMDDIPDGVMLRLTEVNLGKGWLKSGINSLEIHEGPTSLGNLLITYTSENFTEGTTIYSSGKGLYIRLRGVFNAADKLSMVYTGVSNITQFGCPSTAGFLCDNMWCIHDKLICDNVDHCGDNSDENPFLVCSRQLVTEPDWKWEWQDKKKLTTVPAKTVTEPMCFGKFRCHDDTGCIDPRLLCDQIDHCEDRSDETSCSVYDFRSASTKIQSSVHIQLYCFVLLMQYLHHASQSQ